MKNYKSDKPCIVCGECRDGYVCYHHIYSRKAFPEFKSSTWNMMPLCQKHHNEAHAMSDSKFAAKYKSVSDWLELNGWHPRLSGGYGHYD
jgi:5-methylcytosine-specific restriction endonuclease McrA